MITDIRISNYKSFHPKSVVDIKLNHQQLPVLMYGLNGAGKSSIGEVIDRHSRAEGVPAGCSVTYKGEGSYRVLVYNHEFVDRVVRDVAGMPGIFTLGEVDAATQREIEKNDGALAKAHEEVRQSEAVVETMSSALAESESVLLTEVWKAHTEFSATSLASLLSHGNNRRKFSSDLEKIHVDGEETLPTVEELAARLKDASGDEQPKTLLSLDVTLPDDVATDPIWGMPISASGESQLSALVARLGNSDWVAQGREFDSGDHCPYCQQKLPVHFEAELVKMLDGSRKEQIDRVVRLFSAYQVKTKVLREAYKDICEREPWAASDATLIDAWSSVETVLNANEAAMKAKVKEPASVVTVTAVDTEALTEALKGVNDRIVDFNARISDRRGEESKVKQLFWKLMRRHRAEAFVAHSAVAAPLTQKKDLAEAERNKASNEATRLTTLLQELRRAQHGVAASVVAINERLSSLGVLSFTIRCQDDNSGRYVLDRPGAGVGDLRSLSEGERTLISFLYFVELINGAEQEGPVQPLARTIAVVDDPISSLSVNYVFDIASLIAHELVGGGGGRRLRQTIVLTHNLFFLHELMKQLKKCQLLRVVKREHSDVVPMNASDMLNDYDALWWILRDVRDQKLPAQMLPTPCAASWSISSHSTIEQMIGRER